MSINDNNVTKERHRWTKAEKQYIKSIVHNYSLQRWTDQDIVDYLREEKKIKIGRSTVTTIKNQVVEEAGNWYLELRESGTKTIAFFKERLDSLLSYQKKLNEIYFVQFNLKKKIKKQQPRRLHHINGISSQQPDKNPWR